MTDEKEISILIAKIEALGASVIHNQSLDNGGRLWTDSVQVIGLHKCGPHPMGPIAFAEIARAAIAKARND